MSKRKEYWQAYYEANKDSEEYKTRKKSWYIANKDKVKIYMREYMRKYRKAKKENSNNKELKHD